MASRLIPLLLCLAVAGCADDPAADLDVDAGADPVTVTSTAFDEGGEIPSRFTCDGEEESPPLAWESTSGDPAAWAVVVDDPDAPGGTFVHWVLLDIPAGTTSLAVSDVPAAAVQADNTAGDAGYAGPCPPSGRHRYRFTVYGLSARTGLDDGAALGDALDAISSVAVSRGTLLATYERTGE
jgi:Raf kinase inhibitor-like YbhB/YbcL family protein